MLRLLLKPFDNYIMLFDLISAIACIQQEVLRCCDVARTLLLDYSIDVANPAFRTVDDAIIYSYHSLVLL